MKSPAPNAMRPIIVHEIAFLRSKDYSFLPGRQNQAQTRKRPVIHQNNRSNGAICGVAQIQPGGVDVVATLNPRGCYKPI